MNNLQQAAKQALETLEASRRSHLYCEDPWYSCPKHEDGCANDLEGDECNCGADEANQKIDQAITNLRAALNLPEQGPVAIVTSESGNPDITMSWWHEPALPVGTKLYTAPTPRKPLTDEEMRECAQAMNAEPLAEGWPELIKFARAIERAHGIGDKGE